MRRLPQIILILSFALLTWLGIQIVHETGHVLGAWATGGVISKVVLHPFAFSRTDFTHNPHPLFVVWTGPIFGCIVPVLAFLAGRLFHARGIYLFKAFAGLSWIGNGVYIAMGSFDRVGDAGDMLNYGSEQWQLFLFGIVTVPLGVYLLNGLGPKFGFGEARGKVNRSAIILTVSLFLIVAAIEMIVNSR